jgi:hypothetical protein
VAALLLLDELVKAGPLALDGLVSEAARLLASRPRWAMAYQSEGGAERLASDALAVLTGFGLARDEGGFVHAMPAAHRYTVNREEP